MIESLSNYALAIICSSFLLNIIQMILPNGENRKYVIFVCSVILTIILINPIIKFLNKDFNISNVIKQNIDLYTKIEQESYQEYYSNEIITTYKENVENGIITRLEEVGYKVHKIECEYDEVSMEPKYLKLTIESNDGTIQPVKIEVLSNDINVKKISAFEELKIKNMLKEVYGVENVDIELKD